MNYREISILAAKDVGPTATEVIDINVKDLLSSLEIIWQTTVATAALMTAPHADCIPKIELVNGSDVLFAMSGKDAQALAFYGTGKMPLNHVSVKATEYMRSVIPIHFGRKLFDKDLALDPRRFENLQLKITHSEAVANASVSANSLTVRGWAFDQKSISPRGFLMSKEIKVFTPVAAGFQYTDLPLDYPYRLLMIESYSTDKEPGEVLAQVKLSEDNDKRVPIDMTGQEILYKLVVPMGEVEEVFEGADAVTATDLYIAPTALARGHADVNANIIAANDDFSNVVIAGNKASVALAVLCFYYGFTVRGFAPHHCLVIPFGDLSDLDDMQPVSELGNLKLITKGAAAVGTSPNAKIIVQQLRS